MQELKLTCIAKYFKTIITYNKQLNIRTALASLKSESNGETRNRKWRIQNSANSFQNLNLIIFIVLNYLISPIFCTKLL